MSTSIVAMMMGVIKDYFEDNDGDRDQWNIVMDIIFLDCILLTGYRSIEVFRSKWFIDKFII